MSVRASMLRSEFPPYLKGGRPSCAPPPAQAVRSPAAPPPVAGEHLFELRLTDLDAKRLRDAMAASGLAPTEAINQALRVWSGEVLGLQTTEGDLIRVPDGEGGR